MVPPTVYVITSSVNAIPHFRHSWDTAYGNAVNEVILQKDGGAPVTYTVNANQVESNGSDIVIWGRGQYSNPGTYVWTIKATGYKDVTITVFI
ncbi:MAG: hypothetical protein RR651_09380 [Lysinibacillus sp.]